MMWPRGRTTIPRATRVERIKRTQTRSLLAKLNTRDLQRLDNNAERLFSVAGVQVSKAFTKRLLISCFKHVCFFIRKEAYDL